MALRSYTIETAAFTTIIVGLDHLDVPFFNILDEFVEEEEHEVVKIPWKHKCGMCSSSPGKYTSSLDSTRLDDEHRLIARYAARLAAEARSAGRAPSEGSLSLDTSRAQRELISQLEAKNREIMREIARLSIRRKVVMFGCVMIGGCSVYLGMAVDVLVELVRGPIHGCGGSNGPNCIVVIEVRHPVQGGGVSDASNFMVDVVFDS
uniref:Uncharacterized protein n=1 Tax=Timema douglasi TaxID=61478 RepID=A0A7R8VCP3_TIMDO|nr:unnamed protein product [Timema douglasi]